MSATTPVPTPLRPNIGSASPTIFAATDRVGLASVVVAAIIAVVLAVAYLGAALEWRSQPFVGVMLTRGLMVDGSIPIEQERWAAFNAGLRRGDHLLGIDDVTFDRGAGFQDAFENFRATMDDVFFRQAITVSFRRPIIAGEPVETGSIRCQPVADGDTFAQCSAIVIVQQFPDADFLAFFVVPFVSGLVVLMAGVGVLILRPNTQVTRMAALGLICLAIFILGIFDINSSLAYVPLWMLATTMGSGAFIALALLFPIRTPIMIERAELRFVPPLAIGALGLLLAYFHVNPPAYSASNALTLTTTGVGLVGLMVLTLRTVYVRRRTTSLVVRDQANSVLIGVLMGLLVGVVWLANLVGRYFGSGDVIPLNTSAMMPFFVLPAFSIAYAALQYRLFDTDRLISQTITYGVMLAGLIGGYFLLVFAASLITRQVLGADNPFLIAIVIFLMAVLFVPIRTRLQERLDRIYFRRRFNYQARVEEFAQQLSGLAGIDNVLDTYRKQVIDVLQPRQMFIFLPSRQTGDYVATGEARPDTDIRFTTDSPLITALLAADGALALTPGFPWPADLIAERTRLLILKAAVIVPLKGAAAINGFVVLAAPNGEKKHYSYEQLRFLQGITSPVSVAVERGQVVESLERRVNEMDVLSSVSQAINFTVEFDDLLELIATQSGRLLQASHFYIALRDRTAPEWSYAFYLENEERLTEREGPRFPIGRDLISDVLRGGQPVRVNNYTATLAERGITPPYEDAALRAWLAVPLLVGSSVSGVLAAGTTALTQTYTDEQMRSFSDIGSLAAASIEKSRLFAETNARARQLAALNDISQKLVASESDIETLLELITGSSADILDAEAGSLLLTTDDASGDLEFRVVTGGAGATLIGRRVPAGKGLVGEVARNARPVIVNDVAGDPRWAGEFGKGAFQTRNVLAVPLVAADRVTGVLELLNKREGIFSRDDAELLATFAGQAAVAIENARLFQLTDAQLSQRLSELETLERIDVELNRSLDLRKVAEITVGWAVENTAAVAALLGIVVGEAPDQKLEIVYQTGYETEDLPAGMDDDLWPLDRGIVARVMRTRQTDLTPDVNFDRDYIPSLRGGISQITLPMMSGGAVSALLVLETNHEPRFRLADLPFLQRLVEHSAIAIANAQLYAELTRANASKSEFVSFVAHELKNPLTSIKGYSDFLLGGMIGGLNDQQKSFLGTIRGAADRMNTIVSDLNDVTKLQTDNLRIDPAPTDVRTIVMETLRPLQKQIDDKGQTVIHALPDDLPRIHADENRIIQVLTNLVSNAYKYSPEGGTITIGAAPLPARRDRRGQELPPALRIYVSDTGIGLSAEDQARLFTPYFRSTNPDAQAQPGTGLGLTITRGIIARHGGEIGLESELGKGTTFWFTMPLATEPEAAPGD